MILPLIFVTSLATTTSYTAPEPQMNLPKIEVNTPQNANLEQPGAIECSCVLFVKSLGFKLPRLIDAGNLDINSRVPIKGGLISLVYGEIHHIAYVESIQPDGIHIKESNFEKCKIGERVIPIDDPNIIGFYRTPDID